MHFIILHMAENHRLNWGNSNYIHPSLNALLFKAFQPGCPRLPTVGAGLKPARHRTHRGLSFTLRMHTHTLFLKGSIWCNPYYCANLIWFVCVVFLQIYNLHLPSPSKVHQIPQSSIGNVSRSGSMYGNIKILHLWDLRIFFFFNKRLTFTSEWWRRSKWNALPLNAQSGFPTRPSFELEYLMISEWHSTSSEREKMIPERS